MSTIVELSTVRGVIGPGGSFRWRLVVDQRAADGAASRTVAIPLLANSTRTWGVTLGGDVTNTKDEHTRHSGVVSDVLTFGTDGGYAVYELTDTMDRRITAQQITCTATVAGTAYTTTGIVYEEKFQRSDHPVLASHQVMNTFLNVEGDLAEYLMDRINLGEFNVGVLVRIVDQLDERVLRLERPVYPNSGTVVTNYDAALAALDARIDALENP